MTPRQRGIRLEQYVAAKLGELDATARPTKASGASTEIADILSYLFYVECKYRSTQNITIDRKVWIDFLGKLAKPTKLPIYVLENEPGDRFVVLDADDFFRLAKLAFISRVEK